MYGLVNAQQGNTVLVFETEREREMSSSKLSVYKGAFLNADEM